MGGNSSPRTPKTEPSSPQPPVSDSPPQFSSCTKICARRSVVDSTFCLPGAQDTKQGCSSPGTMAPVPMPISFCPKAVVKQVQGGMGTWSAFGVMVTKASIKRMMHQSKPHDYQGVDQEDNAPVETSKWKMRAIKFVAFVEYWTTIQDIKSTSLVLHVFRVSYSNRAPFPWSMDSLNLPVFFHHPSIHPLDSSLKTRGLAPQIPSAARSPAHDSDP